ncbi:MAG: C_GCAxxG_C_C family protein [Desulfobacteraceae bacterium]|nr:C_GCAxxG_C_C family protein [Desulfobacteraceae bacterium]
MVKNQSAKDLIEHAYTLGFEYEKVYRGCSQAALGAIYDILKLHNDDIFKAATGFAGGGGLSGVSVCGGYAAAVMAISQLLGRERSNFRDPEGIRFENFKLVREFTLQYTEELGSIICRDIQIHKFGRPYYLGDTEEFAKFEEAGGHKDKCTDVVGKATQLAVKFILETGLVSPPLSDPST